MQLSISRNFTRTPVRPRSVSRTLICPKAVSTMDVTNVIVGVIAVSLILDVGKTFYNQYKRQQDKKDRNDYLE